MPHCYTVTIACVCPPDGADSFAQVVEPTRHLALSGAQLIVAIGCNSDVRWESPRAQLETEGERDRAIVGRPCMRDGLRDVEHI